MSIDGEMAMSNCSHMSNMMKMYFHFGTDVTVLFHGWKVDSAWGMVGSFAALFFMAFTYEFLKMFRERMADTARKQSYQAIPSSNSQLQSHVTKTVRLRTARTPRKLRLIQTILQAVMLSLAYILMLVVMTYNVWLCLAVLLGDAVGYYIVYDYRPSGGHDSTEHCHG